MNCVMRYMFSLCLNRWVPEQASAFCRHASPCARTLVPVDLACAAGENQLCAGCKPCVSVESQLRWVQDRALIVYPNYRKHTYLC